MEKLNKIIEEYLSINTNYAILITGQWGTGKTHYYRNTLVNIIQNTPTFDNASKKYQAILISLFGLKSVEEIQAEIFISLYSYLKDKKVKLAGAIGKVILKTMLRYKGAGEVANAVDEIKIEKGDWIPYNSLVICFDDLERKSPNLNLEELIGFINSIIEDSAVKVIIISNEDKIKEDNFKDIKEKIVGNTIVYDPDLELTYRSILKSKFSGFPTYLSFLTSQKELVLSLIPKGENNFRTLIFGLTSFMRIHSEIELNVKTSEYLGNNREIILIKALKFALAISISFKKGEISYKDRELYDFFETPGSLKLPSLEQLYSKKNDGEIDPRIEKKNSFLKRFYTNDEYLFFNSIYNHITGGDLFKFKEFESEIKEFYHVKEEVVLPQYALIKRLIYPHCVSLSNKEYTLLLKDLLRYSDQGAFKLYDYIGVFKIAVQFDNPLNFDLENLSKRIIRGIKKSNFEDNCVRNIEQFIYIDDKDLNSSHLLSIMKSIIEANELGLSQKRVNDNKRLENLFYENYKGFIKEVLEKYSEIPIFKTFDKKRFYIDLVKYPHEKIVDISFFFKDRYENTATQLKEDIEFLEVINTKIEKKINSTTLLTKYWFETLKKFIAEAIENINMRK